MDKQDLKYAYLNYFRNKSAHNEPIDSENLIEIAGDWEKSNEVLRELIKDGFIESSTPEVDKLGLTIIIDNGLSLTSKGIEEIEKTNFNVSSTNSNKKSENKLLNKIKFSSNTSKTYTFEGILGKNCGNIISTTNSDEKRVQIKGFKVENGLRVLRGFTDSSILALASQNDSKKYQREENNEHLNGIQNFIEKIRPSAKYLPEVTLVARGYENLEKIKISGKLTNTQQGELDNLEYYKLTVKENQLFRVDGNHRLEALKTNNYYIPFSIIIWEETEINADDEAFLFYFLNAKARKLTTEENLKGLVNTSSWEDYELIEANKYIPHLKFLKEQFDNNPLLNTIFCNNKPLKLIAELLEKVDAYIDIEEFKQIAICMGQLLIKNLWPSLLKFNFYCQLLFYVAYKTKSLEQAVNALNNLESWVVKYNFDDTTFNDPILLFNNAEKTNHLSPINIFVAMPYYEESIIDDFNDQFKTLKNELEEDFSSLKNRLNFYKIMSHQGETVDLVKQIMDQIKSAHIFIADVSIHSYTKSGIDIKNFANPNVMFELGIAQSQPYTRIILLKNTNDEIEDIPSDIRNLYYIKYDDSNRVKMREDISSSIKTILKDDFCII